MQRTAVVSIRSKLTWVLALVSIVVFDSLSIAQNSSPFVNFMQLDSGEKDRLLNCMADYDTKWISLDQVAFFVTGSEVRMMDGRPVRSRNFWFLGAYDQTKDRMRIIADNSLESLGGLSTHFVEDSLITGDRWMHCYASRDTVHEKKLGRDRFNRPSYLINPYFAVIAGARIADGPRSIFDLPAFPFNPNKDLAGKLANSSYSGEWVRESEKRSNCYAFEFDLAKSGNINRSVFRGVFKGYPIKDLHMLESKVSWMKVEEIELPEEIVTREYSGNNKKNNGVTELQYRVKWKLNASVDSPLFDESNIGKQTFESIATLFDEHQ